jgi:hypothetical protein
MASASPQQMSKALYSSGWQDDDMTFSVLGIDIQTGERIEIPKSSRLQGLYIIGIQGTGKSGLIENLIIQDIKQGMGVCVLDPHGDLINAVLARMDRREEDVILLDITDYHSPFGINLFTCSDPTNPLEVQTIVDKVRYIFEKLLGVSTSTPLLLEYLVKCTQTLIVNPGSTMAEIPLLLQDGECRKRLLAPVSDSDVTRFWKRFEGKRLSDREEEAAGVLRRVSEFLQPLSRNIVGQSTSTIDLQHIMDEGKILLVKLSTRLPSVSSLIGSILIALILNAAPHRPANKRRQFNLYADEFQRFATEDFATLLEEARKFGIGVTLAHQNRSQLNAKSLELETSLKDRTRSAANIVVFRINRKDADDLAGEFAQEPEEASVETLIPERIETYEVVDGVEPLHALVQNPFDHLARNGHSNPVVNNLVSDVLKPLANALEIARIEEEQETPDLAKARREPVVIQTFNGREYVETRQRLLQGKHLLNQLLFDLMQGNVICGSETMCDRLCTIATTLRGLFGIAPGVTWYQEGSPRVQSGKEYNPRLRMSQTAYAGGFTKGYWKEVAFDDQSAAGLSHIVQALSHQAPVSKDTLTQARLAFHTGKTEAQWEQEYLRVASEKRNAEQQEMAFAALLAKKWERLATLVTLDNCFRTATDYHLWEVVWYLEQYTIDGHKEGTEKSLHEVFNPHNNYWYTDIKWGTTMKRIQAGMTRSGLECLRQADIPAISYLYHHCSHPRLCEGYRFKKAVTDKFISLVQMSLWLSYDKLRTGSEEKFSHLVADSWHEINKTTGHVNRQDALQAVAELIASVNRITKPLYEEAIFWFAPTCHVSHLNLGLCQCKTDPMKCPYRNPCACQECRQLRATAPRLGAERTNKGKHGEDWPALGTWEYTAFPQAVTWVKEFARGVRAEMDCLRQELKDAEEAHRQNGRQYEEACKGIATYEQSQTSIPLAQAEAERAVMFLAQLFQLCRLLADPNFHITIPSGQHQPRRRQQLIPRPEKTLPHPRRLEQDMVAEMARVLTNLPLYTARVKTTTGQGLEEHTIRTLDPKKDADRPLFGQALQDRLARIKKQNIDHGYLRERATVEEEIRQRQDQYSQPPEDEPPISRRPQR